MIRAHKPAPKKVARTQALEELVRRAKSVVLADFTGMPVSELDKLRRECYSRAVAFRVEKNTLAKLVLERLGHHGLNEYLNGPTAFCLGFDDPVVPIRMLAEFNREFNRPVLKACLMEGRAYGPEEIEKLRDIPPREVLLAQIVSAVASPLSGLVFVLGEILRSFVSVLDALAQKAEGEPAGREGLTSIGGSVEQIISAIEKMTVLELVQLKKALEERFGVTAAAPVAVAAAAGGAAAAAPAAEEKTEFTVVLTSGGEKKIQVIKEVRALTNLGLKEAKDLVEGAPKVLKEGVSKEEAMAIKAKIEEAGGQVEIK